MHNDSEALASRWLRVCIDRRDATTALRAHQLVPGLLFQHGNTAGKLDHVPTQLVSRLKNYIDQRSTMNCRRGY